MARRCDTMAEHESHLSAPLHCTALHCTYYATGRTRPRLPLRSVPACPYEVFRPACLDVLSVGCLLCHHPALLFAARRSAAGTNIWKTSHGAIGLL
jgi:hypothetical protein